MMLQSQSWRMHVESLHVNGRRAFKRKLTPTDTFSCTECAAELPTNKAREAHRRKLHNITKKKQALRRKLREEKATQKKGIRESHQSKQVHVGSIQRHVTSVTDKFFKKTFWTQKIDLQFPPAPISDKDEPPMDLIEIELCYSRILTAIKMDFA